MIKKGLRLSSTAGFGIFLALALFALLALLTVVLGAGVYRSVVARAEDSHAVRSSLAYITGKLRSLDEGGEVRIERRGGSDVLALSEEVEGEWYDTRIYVYNGRLYEVFAARGMRFEPEGGQAIARLDDLRVEMEGGRLIRLEAESGGGACAVRVALER